LQSTTATTKKKSTFFFNRVRAYVVIDVTIN